MERVTTRQRGTIPGCKPAGNEHTIPHDPGTDARTNAWLASLRAEGAAWRQRCKDMGIKHWSE